MMILSIFIVLLVLICINVPIAVALAVAAVVGLWATEGAGSLVTVALDMYDGSTKFSLIAIPMFVLAGAIMNAGGITDRLINFVAALIGFVRGGLGMVNIGVSLFFAEISGSAVADVAALGSVMIPQMKKRGYSAPLAAAITSSSASLAIIIPPSIPMIVYGVSANASVEQLFVAGIVPGLMGAAGLMGVAYGFARKYNLPTEEAAGLAVVTAIGLSLYYREVNFKRLRSAMIEGGIQTAVVMLLVAASVLMGGFLTRAQVPQELAQSMMELTSNKNVILMILNVFFLIIGFFLHSVAAIILVVPIVVPLIELVGIDPVHFGLIVTLNLAIGQQTPPVASVLITSCSIAKANIWDVSKVNVWFVAVLLIVLLMCTYIPAIPMFLVEYFYR